MSEEKIEEFTRLGDDWFDHLEGRRRAGHDVLSRRRAAKTGATAPEPPSGTHIENPSRIGRP